ncbi:MULTISPECIES: hypothetical protein [unclassified Streptomyces]|uniref:hypothetical protein n=1 Tax=unclassified Streptomyces TaxID=2593676 RepID=UPI00380929D9
MTAEVPVEPGEDVAARCTEGADSVRELTAGPCGSVTARCTAALALDGVEAAP